MTLVNTPAASVRADNDTPTSYEEFLDVLAGLRLSSSRIDIDIDRGQVTLDGRDAGLSAKEHDLLAHLAANAVPVSRLWVNPDCGLKTRGYVETKASLDNLVSATRQVRAQRGLES